MTSKKDFSQKIQVIMGVNEDGDPWCYLAATEERKEVILQQIIKTVRDEAQDLKNVPDDDLLYSFQEHTGGSLYVLDDVEVEE